MSSLEKKTYNTIYDDLKPSLSKWALAHADEPTRLSSLFGWVELKKIKSHI